MVKIRYKILHGAKSENGDQIWKLGKWYRIDGELKMCNHGFHCSRYIQDAMNYVQGDTLAVVEVRDEHMDDGDKECWREMRVIKTYKLDKVASVVLAVASAELVLPNFEKFYPDDKRPRQAIKAAEKWLKERSEAARSAAWSAARSAESAASAAESAASAAWSAAESAASAAESAASAAWSAARSAAWSAASAASAARSAAWSASKRRIHAQLLRFLKQRGGS